LLLLDKDNTFANYWLETGCKTGVFAGKQLRFHHPRMQARPNHFFALFAFLNLIAQKLR